MEVLAYVIRPSLSRHIIGSFAELLEAAAIPVFLTNQTVGFVVVGFKGADVFVDRMK